MKIVDKAKHRKKTWIFSLSVNLNKWRI